MSSIERNPKSRGRPRKSVLSVCEEPEGDVLCELRRELDGDLSAKECVDLSANDAGKGVRGTASPDKARVKAAAKEAKEKAREEAKALK